MGEVEPVSDIIHLFDDQGDHICGYSNQAKVAHDIYAIGLSLISFAKLHYKRRPWTGFDYHQVYVYVFSLTN